MANKKPVMSGADSPNLIQNKYKELEGKKDQISLALNNALTFAGDFKFDKNDPNVISSITRIKSAEECADRLNWFFETCKNTGQLPTVEKMYLALGITRATSSWWNTSGLKPEINAMIDKAKNIIATMDSELAYTGTLQPIVYIFRAKNYYSMVDKVDIQASTVDPTETNHKLLEDKYKDVITVEATESNS